MTAMLAGAASTAVSAAPGGSAHLGCPGHTIADGWQVEESRLRLPPVGPLASGLGGLIADDAPVAAGAVPVVPPADAGSGARVDTTGRPVTLRGVTGGPSQGHRARDRGGPPVPVTRWVCLAEDHTARLPTGAVPPPPLGGRTPGHPTHEKNPDADAMERRRRGPD